MAAVWAFSLHVFLVILAVVHHVASDPCALAGESISGSSGFFNSPNFPNNFAKDSDCTWKITVPVGRIIKVSFLNFTLEPNQQTDCTNAQGARVFITNVASNDNAIEFKLCGQNLPDPVYSVGNFIQVRLLSSNNQFSGFNASYMAISADNLCPTMAQLTEASGVITSPFHPRRYPNHKNCNWQITAKKGNRVKLEIAESMDVSECGSKCVCDYIEVENGFDTDGAASGKKCGTPNKVLTYYSVLDKLNVQFLSDGTSTMQSKGFSAIYTQLNYTPPVCPTEAIALSGNGSLSSPNYPMSNYPASRTCTWNITGTAGKRLKFSFTDFALGSCSSACSSPFCTYVEVYDGNSESSPLLERFCYNTAQEDKVSSGNQMFVKFRSGFSLNRGFEAHYSETSDGPSPTVEKPTTPAKPPTTTAKAPTTPATVDISDVERNGAVLKLERKEFLSNGNRTSYTQIIVKQLEEEGQNIGTSTDQKYAAKYIVKDYENRVDGEPYITAEFNYDKGKESFTIGDEKYYSRSKSGSKKYLNGELDSGTNYAVFQRSFDAYRSYDSGSFIRFKTKKGFPWLTVLLVVILIVVLALALIAFACWLVKKKRRNRKVSSKTDNVEMNSAGSHGKLVNGAENHAADHNQNPMYETLHEKQAPAGGAVGNPTDGESVDSGQNADYEIPDEAPRQEGDYELIKEGSGAQEGHYQQLQLNSRTDYENFNTTL